MRLAFLPTLILALAAAGGALAEVIDAQPNGFEVKATADIAAPAAKVWDALGHVGAWSNSAHSFSGDGKNLSMQLKPGGCFCERLPRGGGVRHMTVVYAQPGHTARLSGALGPLQGLGLTGHLTWTLAEKGGHTTFTQTYDVGGYVRGGAGALAAPVDAVLIEQLARLKRYAETGKTG